MYTGTVQCFSALMQNMCCKQSGKPVHRMHDLRFLWRRLWVLLSSVKLYHVIWQNATNYYTMKISAAVSSESFMFFYQATWCHFPANSNLHSHNDKDLRILPSWPLHYQNLVITHSNNFTYYYHLCLGSSPVIFQLIHFMHSIFHYSC
jgi:hypothetical protein